MLRSKDVYRVKLKCANCGAIRIYSIPKGWVLVAEKERSSFIHKGFWKVKNLNCLNCETDSLERLE